MKGIGITTVGDLYALDMPTLEQHFGRYGHRLYELARGIDDNPVVPNRASKSISAEDTFEKDIPLAEAELLIRKLADKVWVSSKQNACMARTIVLKLKTKEFNTLTRSLTPPVDARLDGGVRRYGRVVVRARGPGPAQLFRLVGVGLSNFQMEPERNVPLFAREESEKGRLLE